MLVGDGTGIVDSRRRVASREIQQAQTDTVGLLFVLLSMVGNGVAVLIVLDVVINIHLDGFNVGVVIRLSWQGRQSGFIQ